MTGFVVLSLRMARKRAHRTLHILCLSYKVIITTVTNSNTIRDKLDGNEIALRSRGYTTVKRIHHRAHDALRLLATTLILSHTIL